jgi:hypothetical protein
MTAVVLSPVLGMVRFYLEYDRQTSRPSMAGEPAIDGCIPSLVSGCLGSTLLILVALVLGIAAIFFYAKASREARYRPGQPRPTLVGLVLGIVAICFTVIPLTVVVLFRVATHNQRVEAQRRLKQGAFLRVPAAPGFSGSPAGDGDNRNQERGRHA